jgi:hypothetical protein
MKSIIEAVNFIIHMHLLYTLKSFSEKGLFPINLNAFLVAGFFYDSVIVCLNAMKLLLLDCSNITFTSYAVIYVMFLT